MLKICRSIIKKNKGFSICLCLMSLLCIASSVLAANFASSTKNTIDNFFDYTGVPDALVSTELIEESALEEVKNIDGIKDISTRFVFDLNVETKSGKRLSSRLLSYDENGPYQLEFQNKTEIENENPNVYVSYEFAEYNNLSLGDEISLVTPLGNVPINISATISSVETFKCIKDEMSNYEAYQFGYIYIPKTELQKAVDLGDLTNSFSIYFEDGIDDVKQKEILQNIETKLSTSFVSCTIIKEMSSIISINDDIATIKVLCVFIPGVVLLISLGFSFVFLKIIIEDHKKTIALLKSLGYSTSKIIGVFILFTVLINLVGLIIGLPSGYLLLRLCVGLVTGANGILQISLSFSYLLTIGLITIVFAIGALASLFTAKSISKIDPSNVLSTFENEYIDPPKALQKINCNPFVKISLTGIFRKYKRLIVGFLCMTACIITMCVGFEGNLTIAHPINAVYGERFKYDLMVRDIDESDYLDFQTNISNISVIEPTCFFETNVGDKKVNVSSIVEKSELITLKNGNGEILYPNDGVIIDEMYAQINNVEVGQNIVIGEHELEVTGIAREIAVTYFYVSQETAEDVFSASINCILIKADDISKIENIKKQIIDINPMAYLTELTSQKENMDSRCKAMRTIMLIFSVLAFLIGSLFVFNMTIIDFNEKKNQYGTLRALGASINKLTTVSLIENLTRLIIGILLAVPLSYVFVTILLRFLSNESTQYVMVNFWPCLFIAIGISLIYIVVSLLISRRAIKKMNILERINEME